jgi:hypothetical protein
MKTVSNVIEGLITLILLPFIVVVGLYFLIRSIVIGLLILFYAFGEGITELWRVRP